MIKKAVKFIFYSIAWLLFALSAFGLGAIPWGWKRSYEQIPWTKPPIYGWGYRHLFVESTHWYMAAGGKLGVFAFRFYWVDAPYSIAPGSITEYHYDNNGMGLRNEVVAPTGEIHGDDYKKGAAGPPLYYRFLDPPFVCWYPTELLYHSYEFKLRKFRPTDIEHWVGDPLVLQIEMPYGVAFTADILCLMLFGWISLRINQRLKARKRNRAYARQICPKCSYDLRAHAPGSACPECGTPIPASPANSATASATPTPAASPSPAPPSP